jgi:hypothetical protein
VARTSKVTCALMTKMGRALSCVGNIHNLIDIAKSVDTFFKTLERDAKKRKLAFDVSRNRWWSRKAASAKIV